MCTNRSDYVVGCGLTSCLSIFCSWRTWLLRSRGWSLCSIHEQLNAIYNCFIQTHIHYWSGIYGTFHFKLGIVFCNKWTQTLALDDYVAIIVFQEKERLFSETLYLKKMSLTLCKGQWEIPYLELNARIPKNWRISPSLLRKFSHVSIFRFTSI